MKLALYQSPPTDGDTESAFARLGRQMHAAAAAGAGMLLAPELYLPGYNRFDLHHECGPEGEMWKRRLASLAHEAGCGLTIGWAEAAGGRLWNAATVFGTDGTILAHYRKIQPYGPDETRTFASGDRYVLFDWEERQVGLLICYDIEFPEHARALAERGADLLLVPTANPAGFEEVPEILVPARAAESGLTVAYANYCGTERGLTFGGGSVIAGPDGRVVARAGRGETLIVVDLPDPEPRPPRQLRDRLRPG